MDDKGVYQELAEFNRCVSACCYSLFMNSKQLKGIALKSLITILLAMLFVSLLAQRLFHPR